MGRLLHKIITINGEDITIYPANSRIYHNRKLLPTYPTGKNRRYLQVKIGNKLYYVHRLIATAFIPNPDNKPFVLHKNGNAKDNYYKNLEWATKIEVIQLNKSLCKIGFRALNYRGSSKLSEADAYVVVDRLKSGETLKEIGADYGVSDMSIHRIKKRYLKQD